VESSEKEIYMAFKMDSSDIDLHSS